MVKADSVLTTNCRLRASPAAPNNLPDNVFRGENAKTCLQQFPYRAPEKSASPIRQFFSPTDRGGGGLPYPRPGQSLPPKRAWHPPSPFSRHEPAGARREGRQPEAGAAASTRRGAAAARCGRRRPARKGWRRPDAAASRGRGRPAGHQGARRPDAAANKVVCSVGKRERKRRRPRAGCSVEKKGEESREGEEKEIRNRWRGRKR
ncbi:hypothetical protein BRADI_1g23516v3 [Brachypodium distachyon]|uniref:Uncharacterized protein n=1 Tax=Brachypodium distachyon TaxID=15368 RepID=A0A2K2DKR7_BRADI|nr:hypothetical protein BRADI_1g23516v3 [Brachypodium distachyon]PNT74875.1 hypothetical protein BRADI_1g23516v3 [Brachypodium distachyon]